MQSDDELIGQSLNDKAFLDLRGQEVTITEDGNIQFPLPVKFAKNIITDNHNSFYVLLESRTEFISYATQLC